ncbi:lysophospholipase L1-like esterase [Allocatelliglobosispora scoriae]|uniref:Lysophospholipase L1-like esterase n=1 Tax=Allocatelliglobosispora scoriae TaxID=643052 RepID=A0A841BRN0_9ACTN|nr:SGNH/GDSL hydrolase family protein [Allocatelliglobosispora scoriae]MBB5870365.1 lysophospholipase L1-like esterase [Allocatelliglobosispora scoriae]
MSSDSRGRRIARLAAFSGGAICAAGIVTAGVLFGQVEVARRTIPLAEAPPPRTDGRYGQRFNAPPVTVAVLGDSSAAGYGVRRARQTPGALIATGISRRLSRPVELRSFAVVGCTSARMWPQVEAALELRPDLVIIMIGANDVTHSDSRAAAVRYLADAVRALRACGAAVVVGTCPDLGAVQPIRPPLRWLARHWSRQMATAQTIAVVEAGGWTVSLGDLLGPRFAAEPTRFFGDDRYHPSAEGYAAAGAALLPTSLAALGAREVTPVDTAVDGVRSLPRAAAVAARRAGTEVSGAQVGGRDRGPAGRWAKLRHRMRWHEELGRAT